MEIFNGYTTGDVLFDVPLSTNDFNLYPVRVRQYKQFEEFTKYFVFSKKHYNLDNKSNLFEFVIAVGISTYRDFYQKRKQEKSKEELLEMVIKDFEKVFSIICREEVICDLDKFENQGEIVFTNRTKNMNINRNNFELIRTVVLKQNGIREPKIFENITEERMAQKYMKAQSRKKKGNTISELGEIANLISCVTGKSYEQLYNQNIMQLYADYFRCISIEAYKANVLFMTVSDKVTPNEYTEDVISKLFSDPYEGMWKDKSSFGFLQ